MPLERALDTSVADSAEDSAARLLAAGLRPTRQRLMICEWMFDGHDKHFTAEDLYSELKSDTDQPSLSLATIYNTLKGFTEAGLLSTLSVDSGRLYYDTNTSHHYHLYDEHGQLSDVKAQALNITGLPDIQPGYEIDRVDVIIRTKPKS